MRCFFIHPAHRWTPVALLCQALLVAFVSAPVASGPRHVASASDGGPQRMQQAVPLFSEVLSVASRPLAAIPASTPLPTSLPAVPVFDPREEPPATPVPPTPPPTMTPAPVQHAAAPPTLPPLPTAVTPEQPAVTPPTSTPVPLPPPAPPTNGCERIIELVNQARRDNGLAPLAYNPLLAAAAQQYANFLASHDVLNHTADGRTLDARAEAAGYTTWVALGENLAGGYTTFDEAVAAWLGSPAHRENIMNPGFTETGVACVWSASSAYGSFFVQEFGTS